MQQSQSKSHQQSNSKPTTKGFYRKTSHTDRPEAIRPKRGLLDALANQKSSTPITPPKPPTRPLNTENAPETVRQEQESEEKVVEEAEVTPATQDPQLDLVVNDGLLRDDVPEWNRWRQKHSQFRLILTGANLNGLDLRGVDLTGAILKGATLKSTNLSRANLQESDLSGANLTGAILRGTDLSMADLSNAKLTNANLIGANLKGAILRGADLRGTIFDSTDLTGTIFDAARMYRTVFGDVDLSVAQGLVAVKHRGPSIIGLETIARSKAAIPESFLIGVGVADAFLPYMRGMRSVIQPLTCFISYAQADENFVAHLHNNLQNNGVRCWLDPENSKQKEISSRIDDKLLIVLTKHSVDSAWFQSEVEFAKQRQAQLQKRILFLFRLDDAVMPANKKLENYIVDFTLWQDPYSYHKALSKLVGYLKAE